MSWDSNQAFLAVEAAAQQQHLHAEGKPTLALLQQRAGRDSPAAVQQGRGGVPHVLSSQINSQLSSFDGPPTMQVSSISHNGLMGDGEPASGQTALTFSEPSSADQIVAQLSASGTVTLHALAPQAKQVCTFFVRTGTCAYGDRCKFIHPANCPPPQLNSRGYPLRGSEPDCAHYLKKGWCAFGLTCKFNHPELTTSALLGPYGLPSAVTPTPFALSLSHQPAQQLQAAAYTSQPNGLTYAALPQAAALPSTLYYMPAQAAQPVTGHTLIQGGAVGGMLQTPGGAAYQMPSAYGGGLAQANNTYGGSGGNGMVAVRNMPGALGNLGMYPGAASNGMGGGMHGGLMSGGAAAMRAQAAYENSMESTEQLLRTMQGLRLHHGGPGGAGGAGRS